MIVSHRDNRTRDFAAAGKFVKAFSGIDRPVRLKLDRLEAVAAIKDLAALPGNRFEASARRRWRSLTITRRINERDDNTSR
jgi:plasmid maintenance system killer protein